MAWSISPSSLNVNETAGTATFTVNRSSGTAAQTVFVSTTTNQGSSNRGDYDYKYNESLTFAAGQTSKQVPVRITDDTTVESNETFGLIVQQSASDPASTYLASARFTIIDNDTAPLPSLSVNDITVNEGAGTAEFTVSLSQASSQTVSARYSTLYGTANAGGAQTDYYGLIDQTLSFSPGQTSKKVAISLINDSTHESNEYFDLLIENPANATIADSKGRATITDNDQVFYDSYILDAMDAEKHEGDSGITEFVYRLRKVDGTSSATSVNYSVLVGSGPGNADAVDFGGVLPSGRIDFAVGDTQKPLKIPVTGDRIIEDAEYFKVSIIYSRGVTEANGFILNDDSVQPPLDTTAPKLSSTTPSVEARDVQVGANIVLTFNEKVVQGTGAIEVRTLAGNFLVPSAVTFNGTAVTIDPNGNLAPDTHYYITVPTGAIKDLAGNNFAGITSPGQLHFTTAATANRAPTVAPVDKTLQPGEQVALSQLFSASDPDGDPITRFLVRDRTDQLGSAVLVRDDDEMKQGQLHDPDGLGIPYSELPLWKVKAGTKAGVDEIGIQVFDSNNAISVYGPAAKVTTAMGDGTTLPEFIVNVFETDSITGHFSGLLSGPRGEKIHLERQMSGLINGIFQSEGKIQDIDQTDYEHRNREFDYQIHIKLTQQEYDNMLIFANKYRGKVTPDEYYLFGRNCVDFVDDWYNSSGAEYGLRDKFSQNDFYLINQIGVLGQWMGWKLLFPSGPGDYLRYHQYSSRLLGEDNGVSDKLYGTYLGDPIIGKSGNDTLIGNGGNDYLVGGTGSDSLEGGNGHDFLLGGNDNDTMSGGAGIDTLDGGTGNNTADYRYLTKSQTSLIDLQNGYATIGNERDTLKSIENVWGGAGRDDIRGNGTANELRGNGGNDEVAGGDGDDVLYGDAGNDGLYGGGGNDKLYGGADYDRLEGGLHNDTLQGGAGNDVMDGGDGADTVDYRYLTASQTSLIDLQNGYATIGSERDTLKSIENVWGGAGRDDIRGTGQANELRGNGGNDEVAGGDGDDLLYGDAGNDGLYGGGNNDKLYGGANDDRLEGGLGNDTLEGGAGKDRLIGGAGKDVFDFNSASDSPTSTPDVIAQSGGVAFDAPGGAANNGDVIDLKDVYGGVLTFRAGGAAFTGINQVRVISSGSDSVVQVNLSGNTTPEMQIIINDGTTPHTAYTATDFLL